MNIIVCFTPARLPCIRPGDERVGGTTKAPTAKRTSAIRFLIPFSVCWLSLLLRWLLLSLRSLLVLLLSLLLLLRL